jgi:HNH endonuclease
MTFEWNGEKCIVCNLTSEERCRRRADTAEFTEEHLIPKAIGGKLTCYFLCKHCNDHLGVREASLKTDARVRLAIENLKNVLPDLWAKMSDGQAYVVQGSGGSVGAKLKKGEIRFDSWKAEGGSFFRPTDEAWPAIQTTLLRGSLSPTEIAAAKKRFDKIPEGMRSEVAPGIDVLKRTADEVYPSLKLAQIDIALLKIAYEYVALHSPLIIVHPYFDPIRSALTSGEVKLNCCTIEVFRQKDAGCRPYHRISAKNTRSGLLVTVLLFGYLSYHVELLKFQMPINSTWCYTLNLETGDEEWI